MSWDDKLQLAAVAVMTMLGVELHATGLERGNVAGGILAAAAGEGPLQGVDEIVFAARLPYDDPHWYANIGYYCDDASQKAWAGNGEPDVGRLCKLNIGTGKVTCLLDDRGGSVRDPQVHYDAQKILFSYRKAGTEHYHLYEIQVDGTGLRQVTSGPFDDYEPAYLPDGGIVFVSTRCRCWVNCWKTQVGVLYRCDANGGNLHRLSYNHEHDNTPWVLPDGRILYTRWEYVDRSQVEFHHLWTMNPDGTEQTIFFGNTRPGTLMIDAKPIPGSHEVIASFSPGHGVTDHKGVATIVSPRSGPDDEPAARPLQPRDWQHLSQDPYALSADSFLLARDKQIVLLDHSGREQILYTHTGEGEVREPRPLLPRHRERVIPPRTDPGKATGTLVLADVYQGRNMQGVQRGEIKKLLVVEILPKQVNFSGGPDLVSWLGTFTLERVLGTVPVADDGSACFELPAGRPVFFVALDQNDLSVQRMHSFTSVMPGEVTGCVGCHEPRSRTPDLGPSASRLAFEGPPSQIKPFDGLPDVLDFPRDIQPILDRHCVACHNAEQRDGKVNLTGDLGFQWSLSYFTLFAHRQVGDGRNGLGNYPPRSVGSSASPLLEKLGENHYDVRVSPREWRTVWLWIESGAPYAGSYAGLRNLNDQNVARRAAARIFAQGAAVLQQKCATCHAVGDVKNETDRALPFLPNAARNNRGLQRPTAIHERVVLANDPIARFSPYILLNFTRPRLSPLLLGPLAKKAGGWESCGAILASRDDSAYQTLLNLIEQGKAELDAKPRYGTPGFQPNQQYCREMRRFGILPANFDSVIDTVNIFQTDQAYWKSFWHQGD